MELLDRAAEIIREGRFEFAVFPGYRVFKDEFLCVKRQPLNDFGVRNLRRRIERVAQNRCMMIA